MQDKKINVSKHSKQRCKERLGISKKHTNKIAEKALQNGIRYTDVNGSLRRYMGYLYESHNKIANNIIIYNHNVYIFQNTKLITIMHLPNQYLEISDKAQKRVNERRNENG